MRRSSSTRDSHISCLADILYYFKELDESGSLSTTTIKFVAADLEKVPYISHIPIYKIWILFLMAPNKDPRAPPCGLSYWAWAPKFMLDLCFF